MNAEGNDEYNVIALEPVTFSLEAKI